MLFNQFLQVPYLLVIFRKKKTIGLITLNVYSCCLGAPFNCCTYVTVDDVPNFVDNVKKSVKDVPKSEDGVPKSI
jgi:hypothetical protein